MFLKNLIYFYEFKTIEINNETINLLDYCLDSRKHFSMMRIAQTYGQKRNLSRILLLKGGNTELTPQYEHHLKARLI